MVGKLVGELRGYDPEHPEWLGWDLRLLADNADRGAGYETAAAAILRIAAHQFDGLRLNATHSEALAAGRTSLQDPTQ